AVSDKAKAAGGPGDEDKLFIFFYTGYWIAALLVLLGVVGLAFWDLVAIRRYGRRQFQKLQADRRAMIERQAARLRGQRNGHASDWAGDLPARNGHGTADRSGPARLTGFQQPVQPLTEFAIGRLRPHELRRRVKTAFAGERRRRRRLQRQHAQGLPLH